MPRFLAITTCVVFLTAGAARAQRADALIPAPPAAGSSQTVIVSGTIHSNAGTPLGKTTVRLRRSSPPPTGLDADAIPITIESLNQPDGKFVIRNVAPGEYTLSAQRAGFVTQSFGARKPGGPGVTMRVTPGGDLTGLVITMTPQGLIYGTVTDADGDLLSGGVRVEASRFTYDANGKRRLTQDRPGTAANVGPDGEFVIGNLAPGRYYLSATRGQMNGGSSFRAETQGPRQQPVATYHPDTTDLNSAAAVDVRAGYALRGINIRMQKAAAYEVRGKITNLPTIDAAQRENCYASVALIDSRAFQPWMQSSTIASWTNGSFAIRGAAAGEYTLLASLESCGDSRTGPGGETPHLVGYTKVTVRDDDVTGISLPLQAGLEVHGTVKLSGSNQPLEPSMIFTHSDLVRFGDEARVDTGGAFILKNLLPARYSINAGKTPPGAYLKSMRYSGVEIDSNAGLDLTNSSTTGQLEILFAPGAAEISGSVRNKAGELAKNVTVIAWKPKAPGIQLNPIQNRRTDNNGTFTVKDLGPGVYYVAAWEELDFGLSGNRDFLARFQSAAARVELMEGSKASADAPLISSEATEVEIAKLP